MSEETYTDLPKMDVWLKENRLMKLDSQFKKEGISIEDLLHLQKQYLEEFMSDLGLKGLQKSKLVNALKELKKKHGSGGGGDGAASAAGGDDADDELSQVIHVVVSPDERALLSKIEEKQKEVAANIKKYETSTSDLEKMSAVENEKLDASFVKILKMLDERKEQYLRELNEAFVKKESAIKVELAKSEKYDDQFADAKKKYNAMVKDSGVSLVSREGFLKEQVTLLVDASTLIATEAKVTFDWNAKGNEVWVNEGLANINTYEKPVFAPVLDIIEAKPTYFEVEVVPSESDLSRDRSKGLRVTKFELRLVKIKSDPRDSFDVGDDGDGNTTTTSDEKKEEKKDDEKKDDEPGEPKLSEVERSEAGCHKVDGLPWGTEYSLEARSFNSYGYGPWSVPTMVKTMSPTICVVSRGTYSGSWSYGATPFAKDALAVTVSKDVCLVGTGVWLGAGSTRFKMNVYKGTNHSGATALSMGDEKTYTRSAKNTTPIMYRIKGEGIVMKAHQKYTIENLQKGPSSHKTSSTSATTKMQDGVSFSFSTASQSPNGTLGQIPCLYFYVM